ncbi:MAG: arylsulfatase A-like enzyme [Planctomycetota bacterium]|jgi:arylsulfatase A-like enzyme
MMTSSNAKTYACQALLATCLFVGASCSPTPDPTNLLLVVVDSLRADRLDSYGHDRPTPVIAKLAAEGVIFDEAYACAPWTMPSVAAMFTGLPPTIHGATNTDALLAKDLETLAERLASKGYATSAVVSHHLIGKRFQFDQGFESFDEELGRGHKLITSAMLTEKATNELTRLANDERKRPFFLFLHYFDPHYDYRDHAEFDYAEPVAGRLDGSHGIGQLRRMLDSMSDEELKFLNDRYDEEVRFTTRSIGRLLRRLKKLGVEENTLVIFTSDHGEEFRDHGWLGHTQSLYRELVRVPLLMRGPGIPPGLKIEQPVSLENLAATALDLLNIEGEFGTGSSMRNLLQPGGGETFQPVFCEVDYLGVSEGQPGLRTCHKKSIIGERYQLIRDDMSGELELYELGRDVEQLINLAEKRPEELLRLEKLLDERRTLLTKAARPLERTEFDEAELDVLRGLGYVDSESSKVGTPSDD